MIYSKTAEYAIRSLIYFSEHPEKESVTAKEVGRESGVPAAYVAKIFQCLVKSRILTSQRGATGGFKLNVPPSRLSLLAVVHALDDISKSPFSNCIMGLDKCNDRNPCPLHDIWAKAKEKMVARLAATTIADLHHLSGRFRESRGRRTYLSKRMRGLFSI